MRLSIIFVLVMILACQTQNKNTKKATTATAKVAEVTKSIEAVKSQAINTDKTLKAASSRRTGSNSKQGNLDCNTDVCLQLRNHDTSNKSFAIYMINAVPVFGFQCDLPGINISGSDGGLLQENEYQTSNSASRILSFSMQARPIPIGEGVLTTIYYTDPTDAVCMTEIIFAGIGGSKLENDIPECMKLN